MDPSVALEYAYKIALVLTPVAVAIFGQRNKNAITAYHLDVNGRMTKLIEVLELRASEAFQAGKDSGSAIDPAVTAKAAAVVIETADRKVQDDNKKAKP